MINLDNNEITVNANTEPYEILWICVRKLTRFNNIKIEVFEALSPKVESIIQMLYWLGIEKKKVEVIEKRVENKVYPRVKVYILEKIPVLKTL